MTKTATAPRVITTRVDERTAERLERLAREGDRTVSAEVRRALARHLLRESEGERWP
jgi:predicted transcriptional regulator